MAYNVGSGGNFANADLVLTGSRTHAGDGHNLTLSGFGTISMAGADLSINQTGTVGISSDAGMYIDGQSSFVNIGGTSVNISNLKLASVAPPDPLANGHIWIEGTELKIRIGGVTYNITKLAA